MAEPPALTAELLARFSGVAAEESPDRAFEIVTLSVPERLPAVAAWLKGSQGFAMLMDLTAVDYQGYASRPRAARFELVYYFFAPAVRARLRLKVPLPDSNPVAPSLAGTYGDADWLEREVWDMFGIRFSGHPHLARLLMYEEFSGHPLRKDYPLMRQQPRVPQAFPGVPPFGEEPASLKDGG